MTTKKYRFVSSTNAWGFLTDGLHHIRKKIVRIKKYLAVSEDVYGRMSTLTGLFELIKNTAESFFLRL